MTYTLFSRTTFASFLLIATATPTMTWAQEDELIIEEVIVTAQKREQAAQDIPISLFAVTGDTLEQAGINSLEGIRDIAAGLEIVSVNPGAVQIAMRGVTNLSGGIESTAAVGYYLDETPVSSFATAMPEFAMWDANRVEVLRGPQGTLFGEGSMGGTIRVITNKPDSSDFYGRVQGEVSTVDGGKSGWAGRGVVNIPLAEDTLALRLTLSHIDRGGWVEVPDIDEKDTNTIQSTDLRAALRWTPNDKLTVDLSYMYQDLELDNTFGQTSPGVLDPQDQLSYAGPVGQLSTEASDYDLFNLTIDYDLGFASLVSATSSFNQDRSWLDDLGPQMPLFFGTSGPSSNSPGSTTVDVFTQEFRLVSIGDERLDWTTGVFYKTNDREAEQAFYFDLPDWGLVDKAASLQESSADSWAVFAEIDFEFTDRWSGQLGGRYYSDDRELTTTDLEDSLIFGTVAGTVTSGSGSDSHFSPKLALTWTGDDTLFYAKVANGFRSGGTNPNQSFRPEQIPAVYGPEELWSYELGLKNTLAGGQVQLNAYVYFNDWTDLQLGFVTDDGLFGYTENAGSAESTGGELEFLWLPTDRLTWAVNLGYTNAKITEDVYNAFDELIAAKGNRIPFVPKWSLGTTLDYIWPVFDNLEGVVHLGYAFRDSNFSEPSNDEERENDKYSQVTLRGGIQGERWGLYAFVTNLLNEEDTTYKLRPVAATPLTYTTYVRPRTIGVEATWSF
ncbi:MAG: TonB-dependent receptor [Gammaproteobacteria bacterium]|nr:TonB-dependent receptor [Gammaproteobacteria bacterium]